jgi:hypothetical protein
MGKAAAWAAVLAGGALLATLGATAASTADTGSGVGMIVFGLLVVSAGLSGLLGVLHDPDTTGLTFALFGALVPGYSLPFLLYHAGKGVSERAEWRARERSREREIADGARCAECWRPLPGEHASSCSHDAPEVVHRVLGSEKDAHSSPQRSGKTEDERERAAVQGTMAELRPDHGELAERAESTILCSRCVWLWRTNPSTVVRTSSSGKIAKKR